MPRILRVINRLNLGGPAINAAFLTRYLHPRFETMLVAGVIDDHEISSSKLVEQLNVEPVIVSSMHRKINVQSDLMAYRQLKRIIREFKPHIVHTHAAKAGFLARQAAFEIRVPLIIHTFHGHVFHSYFPKMQTNMFIKIERYLATKTNCIIAISESQKRELSETYRIAQGSKFEIIQLGMDLLPFITGQEIKREKFRKKFLIAENEKVVVQVGRLVSVKNHQMLIKVIALLQLSAKNNFRFFIVGDGKEKKSLQQLASYLNIDWTEWNEQPKHATLTFAGWQHEMDEIYAGADVVTLTSLNEGTPVTLIEAMAANRKIVSTDVGGVSDVLLGGKFGKLAGSNDAEAFAKILTPEIVSDLNPNGESRTFALSHFGYERLIHETEKLYDRLLITN